MAILNVVLALILSMFWRQYNNTEQAKIQADAAYTSIKSDYDLISSEFEKVKNRNLLQQQVQERLSKKLKFLEQEFHEDSTPSDSKIYQEMIVCDDVGLLRSFMMNADNSIATQAAWKLVQLTVPETPDNRRHKIDPNKLLEFSNFLEVRNRIRVPSWWRNELQTCK